jgi:sugar phosphate isomerase/epimerase
MKTIKGPGIFLAQFADNEAPFNTLDGIAHWAAQLGFVGVQIPTWDRRLFDLKLASESRDYCEEVLGILDGAGLRLTELSTHLQGQLVASNPAYDSMLDGFAPSELAGRSKEQQAWAVQQLKYAAEASKKMGLSAHATFSGALAWPYFYPWPQRPAGLIDTAFEELGRRWEPILNAFDEAGVDVCFELHPGEDLHDGVTFERFLKAVNDHKRANMLYDPSHMVLQQLDYLEFIDFYHDRIRAFHVKDAEFRPNGRSGVYGGYQDWIDRPGRFRSLGDGQIDFKAIFSRMAQYDYPGWAVLEWECCIKHPKVGASEGAHLIKQWIIRVTDKAFDDFAGSGADAGKNRRVLGLTDGSEETVPGQNATSA